MVLGLRLLVRGWDLVFKDFGFRVSGATGCDAAEKVRICRAFRDSEHACRGLYSALLLVGGSVLYQASCKDTIDPLSPKP